MAVARGVAVGDGGLHTGATDGNDAPAHASSTHKLQSHHSSGSAGQAVAGVEGGEAAAGSMTGVVPAMPKGVIENTHRRRR